MEEKSNNKNIGWCSSYVTIPQSLSTVRTYVQYSTGTVYSL